LPQATPENRKSKNANKRDAVSKVPEVTLVFWIIKILATTLGETGGDYRHNNSGHDTGGFRNPLTRDRLHGW
jgi:hypothetical protein